MCGISVVVNCKSSNWSFSNLKNMTNIVKHRGPDDEGYVVFDQDLKPIVLFGEATQKLNYDSGSIVYLPKITDEKSEFYNIKAALGFRRLSILDLSPIGHQPMSYLDRYWIVFNGEIYNYIELKDELIKAGYSFISNTDTEVILAAYDFWGSECLNKFNGMWAFVIIDTKEQRLFASRDRFGIKPLYYYQDSEKFLFASEIKQFLSYGECNIEPNIKKIKVDLLYDTNEYSTDTAFTNVFRFPKGSYCLQELDNYKINEPTFSLFYDLSYNTELYYEYFDNKLTKQLAEKYYDLLYDSVRLRLRADVEVGTCFSGGLDSSSVVYIINSILKNSNQRKKQKTFSLVFTSKDTKFCDESNFIDSLSNKLDISSYKIEPKLEDVLRAYEEMIFVMDTPQHSSLMSYIFTYKLVKKSGVTVTLDGQGADELQAGYLPYIVNYLSNLPPKRLLSEINSFIKNPFSYRYVFSGTFFNIIKNESLKTIINNYLTKKGYQKDPWGTLNKILFDDLNTNLQTLFHYGDRGAMLHSVENRFPMMDYRLVEFWFNLPFNYKIRNGYTKYLARVAMNNKLPNEIIWRKDKKGWEIPQSVWIKNGLGKLIQKEIDESIFLKEIGLTFSFNNFNKNIDDHRHWKLPIKIYNLALWHKIFFERFSERI